jgi:hypothetical protein
MCSDVSRASKKPGPDLAHGSWFAAGAALPPGTYLEKGTDLPRSAAPMGAIVGTKRSFLLICCRPPLRMVTGTEPVPVGECRRQSRAMSNSMGRRQLNEPGLGRDKRSPQIVKLECIKTSRAASDARGA